VFDVKVYLEFFRRPGLGSLYLQFFLFAFSFSAFMSGFALFAERRFTTADGHPWTAHEVGLLFGYVGLLGIILQGGILGRVVKRVGEVKTAISGFVAVVIAYLALGFTGTLAMLLIVSAIASYGNGVLRPVITSQLTQLAGRHEQGVVIGISASLSSLAMSVAPPIGGALLTEQWLIAWAMVPATAAAIGLIAALRNRAKASRPAAAAAVASP
jgi:MFS family permease